MKAKVCRVCGRNNLEASFSGSRDICERCRYYERKNRFENTCEICGKKFKSYSRKIRFCCKECQNKGRRFKALDIKKRYLEKGLMLIEPYKGFKTNCKTKCLKCDSVFNPKPSNVISNNSGCPYCYGRVLGTTEKFKKKVFELVGPEYKVIGEYVGNHDKIEMKHGTCGTVYEVEPNKFKQGRRCPVCKESHGEQAVRKQLQKMGVIFQEQFKFEDCRYFEPLRFDFAVFKNNKVSALVEFDGEQHFKQVPQFESKDGFEDIIIRDTIKDNYCFEKQLKLIRIPYYKINEIPKILEDSI